MGRIKSYHECDEAVSQRSTTREQPDPGVRSLRIALERWMRDLAGTLHLDVITMHVYDDEAQQFVLPLAYGLWDYDTFVDPAMQPGTDRLAGRLVRERNPIVPIRFNERSALASALGRREKTVAVAGFPMIHADRAVGVLFISFRKCHEFSAEEVGRVQEQTKEASRIVAEANAWSALRRESYGARGNQQDRALGAAAELFTQVLDRPTAIWLDEGGGDLQVRAISAVRQKYLLEARARIGDGSASGQVMATGAPQVVNDLGARRRYVPGWQSALALPIATGHQVLGVVEIFCSDAVDAERVDRRTAARVAEIAATVMQAARNAAQLSKIAQSLSAAPDFARALEKMVESAREMTRADWAIVTWPERGTSRFVIGAVSKGAPSEVLKPRADGLTHIIMTDGQSVLCHNTYYDDRVRPELREMGVLSLAGVRIHRGRTPLGVLYVNGRREQQFGTADVQTLETLAAQLATATGGARWFLDPFKDIDEATARLYLLQHVLDNRCRDIRARLEFEFVTIQLIRPEHRVIETVASDRLDPLRSEEARGLWKHSLDVAPTVRDIQADVAKSKRIEIIGGWDERFDRWIYDMFGHNQLVRVWVPILLVRKSDGTVDETWWDRFDWREVAPEESRSDGSWRIALELDQTSLEMAEKEKLFIYAIGTAEAGFRNPAARITPDKAKAFAHLVSEQALEIRLHLLEHVLQTVAECARRVVGADTATVHYAFSDHTRRYSYEVYTGTEGASFLHRNDPGHHEFGKSALNAKEPQFLPDAGEGHTKGAKVLQKAYPKLWALGVRSVAAFPLEVDPTKRGILYLYFRRDVHFTEDDVAYVRLFAEGAAGAIRHFETLVQAHDDARQLDILHRVTLDLIRQPPPKDLLYDMAGSVRNLLAADVVVIYEYIQATGRFSPDPAISGKLFQASMRNSHMGTAESAPQRLIHHGQDVYAPDSRAEPVLCPQSPDTIRHTNCFVQREHVASSAAVLLRAGAETVGVMFINYRTARQFSDREKRLIRIVASSAGMAMKTGGSFNRAIFDLAKRDREWGALLEVDRQLLEGHSAPDVDQVLKVIFEKAMEVTGADAGDITRYDRSTGRLELVKEEGMSIGHNLQSRELTLGIVGFAATTKQPVVVPDVTDPMWSEIYVAAIPGTRSELAVPIVVRRDTEEELIGVINLERRDVGAFQDQVQPAVLALAKQAIMAVHSVYQYQKLRYQERFLRSLAWLGPRIQGAAGDLDRVLALLLTGVTAREGLGFSRAMVFLLDAEQRLTGRMAVGAATAHEARAVWNAIEQRRRQAEPLEQRWFEELLASAEDSLRAKQTGRTRLNEAVQALTFSMSDQTALTACLNGMIPFIVAVEDDDPFRDALRGQTGEDDARFAFAVAPLVADKKKIGVLAVDKRFHRSYQIPIGQQELEGLSVYASVMALSVDNARLQAEQRSREDELLRNCLEQQHRVPPASLHETDRHPC